MSAKRYNEGKLRLDLVSNLAIEEVAKVASYGAEKYTPRNWEKGMDWTKMIASLRRHLLAFEKRTDYDEESGYLHMAHVAWNAMGLLHYYHTRKYFDDRVIIKPNIRIGVDIDDVLANWSQEWKKHHDITTPLNNWNFSYINGDRWKAFDVGEYDKFVLNLKPLNILPFEPTCYITSRSSDVSITKQWLEANNFPTSPVISLGHGVSKLQACIDNELDVFIDDKYETFVELNNNGIKCYLFDAEHNRKYSVGNMRITNFNEILEL